MGYVLDINSLGCLTLEDTPLKRYDDIHKIRKIKVHFQNAMKLITEFELELLKEMVKFNYQIRNQIS